MGIDINIQKFNSKVIYQKNQITNLESWNVEKNGKDRGKNYTVYQKTFHHDDKAWKFARGALVVSATLFSLGIAYKCSKTLQSLWKQAKTGDEVKKIKVLNENTPVSKTTSDVGKKAIIPTSQQQPAGNAIADQLEPPLKKSNYADFLLSPEFTADNSWYLESDRISDYKDVIANKEDSAFGYKVGYSNLLMAIYFILDPAEKKQEARSYISSNGNSPVNVPAKDRITFMQTFPIYDTSKNPPEFYIDRLAPLLKREIAAHPAGMRPAKILFPVIFNSPNKTPHLVLLVIEPDQKNEAKANITLVNTWGKNTTYKEEEDLVEDEVFKAYPYCTFEKNKIRTFSGPYCSIDVIENARLLANIDDVQKFISENRLPTRDKKTIDQCTLDHAEQMVKLLKNLGKW